MTVRRIIAGAVAAYLLLVLVDHFVIVELFIRRCGLPILAAVAMALAATGAGFLARRLARGAATNFLIGYPILGALCFLAAAIRVNAWTMTPIVVLFAAAGIWSLWPGQRTTDNGQPTTEPFAIAVLSLLAASAIVLAQSPPVSLDELAYHLAVPHAWVLEGRAVELPLISHSYFPLGIESADLPLLVVLGSVGGGIASHFLHLIAAVATTVVIQRRTRSLLLTAAIVSTPALAITAGWSLVDWPLLGVCAVLFVAVEEDDERTIAAALGAGLLIKYTFLPFALIVLAVKRRAKPLTIALGLAIGSVFFIRNLILTGNPIAPFLTAGSPHVIGYRGVPYLSDYVFDGRFLDESLGASLLASSVLAAVPMAWALALAGVALFLLAPSARLLVPFFGVAAMTGQIDRRPLRILLAIAVALQTLLVGYYAERTGAFALIAGRSSDDEYLRRARPSYAGVAWLNGVLPPQSRTLIIGHSETYWFERRVRGGGNFDSDRISRYLEAATPDALRARLAADGITHVAVVSLPPPSAVATKSEERQTVLTPAARRTVAEMLDRYAASVTSRGEVTLFALK